MVLKIVGIGTGTGIAYFTVESESVRIGIGIEIAYFTVGSETRIFLAEVRFVLKFSNNPLEHS